MAQHLVPEIVDGKIDGALVPLDAVADGNTKFLLSSAERAKLSSVQPGATANAADASLRDRATHTGIQSADTLVDGGVNRVFTNALKAKLDGIANGATLNSSDSALLDRANHTGTQTADTVLDGVTNKAYTATEQQKLAGIPAGATVNSTDAALRDRATHTGTQAVATIAGLQAILDGKANVGSGTGSVTSINGQAGDVSLTQDNVPDGSNNKAFTTAEKAKLGTIASGATVNSTDAALRDRSTHTGTQSADTLIDGATNRLLSTAEKSKLGGIATGATLNDTDANLRARASHTGTQSADTLTDGTTNKAFLATERTKLATIAANATVNSTDSQLRDRSTHTGTQAANTITGLGAAALLGVGTTSGTVAAGNDVRLPDLTGAAEGMVVTYDIATGKLVLRAPGSSGTPTPTTVTATTTPLANGATFTSQTYDKQNASPLLNFSTIQMVATANTAFTAKLQSSADGSTWADQQNFSVTANAVNQTVLPSARYARVLVTATTTGMNSFSVQLTFA